MKGALTRPRHADLRGDMLLGRCVPSSSCSYNLTLPRVPPDPCSRTASQLIAWHVAASFTSVCTCCARRRRQRCRCGVTQACRAAAPARLPASHPAAVRRHLLLPRLRRRPGRCPPTAKPCCSMHCRRALRHEQHTAKTRPAATCRTCLCCTATFRRRSGAPLARVCWRGCGRVYAARLPGCEHCVPSVYAWPLRTCCCPASLRPSRQHIVDEEQQRLFGGGGSPALLQGEETGFDVASLTGMEARFCNASCGDVL